MQIERDPERDSYICVCVIVIYKYVINRSEIKYDDRNIQELMLPGAF